MKLRKQICALLIAALLLPAAVGAFGEAADPDYYRIGLKVTGLMGEMADSEAYLSLQSSPGMFSAPRQMSNTHDYDRPAEVYSVSMRDPRALLEEMILENPESGEAWNSLSPALQEQLVRKFSLQALCASINGRLGSEWLAYATLVNPVIREESLTAEESRSYLYLFEKGTPILVSFGYHSASGQFLFIPDETQGVPEDIAAFLDMPFLELIRLEIPD